MHLVNWSYRVIIIVCGCKLEPKTFLYMSALKSGNIVQESWQTKITLSRTKKGCDNRDCFPKSIIQWLYKDPDLLSNKAKVRQKAGTPSVWKVWRQFSFRIVIKTKCSIELSWASFYVFQPVCWSYFRLRTFGQQRKRYYCNGGRRMSYLYFLVLT